MGILKAIDVEAIVARGRINANEVATMRRAFNEDGLITEAEAAALFRIEKATTANDASWPGFFVEAVTDFIVQQTEPEGYLTAANADWVLAHLATNACEPSKTELDLLVNIMDRARWTPTRLSRFALDAIARAIQTDTADWRIATSNGPGTISDAEVETLRRILYAFAGDGSIAVTREEAEALIAIEESLKDGAATPAWTDLFVKALANVVMAASGYACPTREEALHAEAWLKRRGDMSPAAFLTAMVTSNLSQIWDSYHVQSPEERALERLERQRIEIITNEEITPPEAEWLAERLSREDRLTPTKRAFLEWLKREQPVLHPALDDLVRRATAA